jgi:hypothetical protein
MTRNPVSMRPDGLRHRPRPAAPTYGGSGEQPATAGGDDPAAVAADVPPEYRDAYLEGFARVRADRDDSAA